MKKSLKEEIRNKTAAELKNEVQDRQRELVKLKLDLAAAKLKNTTRLRRLADEIAVLQTVLREKNLTEAQEK